MSLLNNFYIFLFVTFCKSEYLKFVTAIFANKSFSAHKMLVTFTTQTQHDSTNRTDDLQYFSCVVDKSIEIVLLI